MKNKIILLMLLSIITAFSYQESYEVLAHFDDIGVSYDQCQYEHYVDANNIGDGINEKWYSIFPFDPTKETSHYYKGTSIQTQTIKYYFSDYNTIDDNDNSYWYDNVTQEFGDKVKLEYANSMKKWNNVYVYIYADDNIVTKRKFINIVDGTSNDWDLIIYPKNNGGYASTIYLDEDYKNYEHVLDDYAHSHYDKYVMRVNVKAFHPEDNKEDERKHAFSRVGAHEIGHILGMDDVKPNLDIENDALLNDYYHHEEVIMGYSKNNEILTKQTNITYKDIAGAMITMGFHTANDHKWMYSPTDYGGYKLICSICNGVKYAPSYPSGSVEFEYCKNLDTDISDHSLSSGNMMPVASYDNYDENGDEYDYYKCKYCRYVAPFTSLVKQDYQYESINNTYHNVKCNIDEDDDNETDYSIDWFNENHYSNYETNTFVPYPTTHPQYALKHKVICGCNEIQTYRAHGFTVSDIGDGGAYNTCLDCNALIPANTGPGIVGPLSNDIWQVTDNGSYKLTNGIIVLVDEDIDSYKKGTLVFKDANSETI